MNHTLPVKSSAYQTGWDSYPFTRWAGWESAHIWLAGQASESLAVYRDLRWAQFISKREPYDGEHEAFNEGFARALAEHIAGVCHD